MIHHYPRAFADVKCKASVKKKIRSIAAQDMNLRYVVPEASLRDFWKKVVRLAASVVNSRGVNRVEFKAPFLMTSEHDLKLHFKRDTASRTRVDFLNSLQHCFH